MRISSKQGLGFSVTYSSPIFIYPQLYPFTYPFNYFHNFIALIFPMYSFVFETTEGYNGIYLSPLLRAHVISSSYNCYTLHGHKYVTFARAGQFLLWIWNLLQMNV
jgi:hypothetical protein